MTKKKELIWNYDEFDFTISLYKQGKLFIIEYGKDVKTFDNYDDAAESLGFAMFHALCIDGKLDN